MTEPNRQTPDATRRSPAAEGMKPGWLAERIHGKRRARPSSWMPWFGLSLLLHAVILGWLAVLKFGTIRMEPPQPIQIDADLVETFRTEPLTHRTVIKADDTVAAAAGLGALAEGLGAGGAVPIMDVDPVDAASMARDLLARRTKGDGPGTGMPKTSDLTRRVTRGGGRDYKAVLDEIALVIAETVRKNSVLCVILFDESQSLLDDRVLVARQLERTWADLKFEITDEDEKRLKWAVVSFGSEPRIWLAPTRDIAKVRDGIAKIGKDESGVENVLKAVKFCVTELAKEAQRMIILLVSDEQGDDCDLERKAYYPGQPHPLRSAVELCKQQRARVYVLGREAMLEDASIYVTIRGLKDQPGNYLMRGLPTLRPELPYRMGHIGIGHGYVPSGFGCYSLSLLADKTGGRFFILSEEKSPYNEEALQAYEPEWCYPDEYDGRTRASRLRATLADIREEIQSEVGHLFPHWEFVKETWPRQQYHWTQRARETERKLRWFDEAIEKLLNLKPEVEKEKFAKKRWQANYDLTLALLCKRKAAFMKYRARLLEEAKGKDFPLKPPGAAEKEKGMIWWAEIAGANAKFAGGREEQNARNRAIQALELVQRAHAGTPWAERARRELEHLQPIRIRFEIVNLPYPPPDTTVRPKL